MAQAKVNEEERESENSTVCIPFLESKQMCLERCWEVGPCHVNFVRHAAPFQSTEHLEKAGTAGSVLDQKYIYLQ